MLLTNVSFEHKTEDYHPAVGYTYIVKCDQGRFETSDDDILASGFNRNHRSGRNLPSTIDATFSENYPEHIIRFIKAEKPKDIKFTDQINIANDWRFKSAIEKAIENNVKEIQWEGTEVNKQGIIDEIITQLETNYLIFKK